MQFPLYTSGKTEDQGPQGHFAAHPLWLQMEVRCLQSQAMEMEPLLKTMGAAGDVNPDLGSRRLQRWAKCLCKMDTGIFTLNFSPLARGLDVTL